MLGLVTTRLSDLEPHRAGLAATLLGWSAALDESPITLDQYELLVGLPMGGPPTNQRDASASR